MEKYLYKPNKKNGYIDILAYCKKCKEYIPVIYVSNGICRKCKLGKKKQQT